MHKTSTTRTVIHCQRTKYCKLQLTRCLVGQMLQKKMQEAYAIRDHAFSKFSHTVYVILKNQDQKRSLYSSLLVNDDLYSDTYVRTVIFKHFLFACVIWTDPTKSHIHVFNLSYQPCNVGHIFELFSVHETI